MTLENEAQRLTELLSGKAVTKVWRHRNSELAIEFMDGTRLFIDGPNQEPLELSVTGPIAEGDG